MKSEFIKRIISSIILLTIIFLSALINDYIFLSILFLAIIFSWIEWIKIIEKIGFKKITKIIHILLFLIYLFIAYVICFNIFVIDKYFFLTILLICILSDIGGYSFGKTFGGKKLTKISPKKTISGAIGSLLFSSTLSLIIFYYLTEEFSYRALILGLVTSIACQLGDLFFSLIKRKSFLKDTGNFLPGHGGILDRVDSILLGLPIGFLTLILFY